VSEEKLEEKINPKEMSFEQRRAIVLQIMKTAMKEYGVQQTVVPGWSMNKFGTFELEIEERWVDTFGGAK